MPGAPSPPARAWAGLPARGRPSAGGTGLFDLTLDDEQQMLVEAWRDFASARLRPAAAAAERGEGAKEIFAEANELGLTMLGVPEELGGAISERSAVTAVLAAETLAHGDAGLAVGALAPAAVATALALWGDADQQATYLPALVSEDVPAAALAIAEPRALFDPRAAGDRRARGARWRLRAVGHQDARAARRGCRAADRRRAHARAARPALFLVEPSAGGVHVKADPAMGLRGAALGRLRLEEVTVGRGALLGAADPKVYAECIARSRLAWAAIAAGVRPGGPGLRDPLRQRAHRVRRAGQPSPGGGLLGLRHRGRAGGPAARHAARCSTRRRRGRTSRARLRWPARWRPQKGMQIGSEGVQLLGGAGYIAEHPVERWYRDLRATGLMEGVLVV